jgi:capsid protein
MVGVVAVQVVHGHQRVADQLVDLPAGAPNEWDEPPEVGVQHHCDLSRREALGVCGEAGEVAEEHGHVTRAGRGVFEVQGAETLLVPLPARRQGDHREREQHQDVPLPPR